METYRIFDKPAYELDWFELVNSLVIPTLDKQGDTEDGIRDWVLSDPKIGETFCPDANALRIKRIS